MLQEYKIKPWAHQLEALKEFAHRTRILLRHEMGTGKTLTGSLCLRYVAQHTKRCPITLILCPNSVVPHWARELRANCYDSITRYIQVLDGAGEKARIAQLQQKGKRVFIVNYDVTSKQKKLWAEIRKGAWEFVILDESHKIKNHKSIVSKECRRLIADVPWRLLLTGTPVTNSPMDLWAQLQALGTGAVDDNFWAWVRRNFYDVNSAKSWMNWPDWKLIPGREEQINRIVAANTHTAEKSQCLDLPPFTRQIVYVDLPPDLRRMYDEMEEDFLTFLDTGEVIARDLAITKLIALQEFCNGVFKVDGCMHFRPTDKIVALADILENIGREKCVIWCNYLSPFPAIEQLLSRMKLPYVRFTGEENARVKQENIDTFNTDPACRVFLATQASGGVGIGLQAASVAVYYSKSWSLEHDIQSEARTYRGGSEIHQKVTRIDIITRDTVEERVHQALRDKLGVAEMLLSMRRKRTAEAA